MMRVSRCGAAAFWAVASAVSAASLSVLDFGAVPDDGQDDAPAIAKAVAQAQAGDTVLIPSGVFHLAAKVGLKTGLALKGAGQSATRLVCAGETAHTLIHLDKLSDVQVTDLTLDGNRSPKAQQGIVVSRCNRVLLTRLAIRDFVDTGSFGPHAILCSGTSDSEISDNTITNIAPEDAWGAGIRCGDQSLRNRILRNRIAGTGRGGIFTNSGATDAVISGNSITGSGGIGFAIEVHSGSVRTVVEDNTVDHGLSIVSANCAVRRNTVTDPGGTWKAYGIEGGGGPDGVVTDNVIDQGQKMGISLSGPQRYMLWARNRFLNCNTWGIQIQGPSAADPIRCLYFYANTFAKVSKGHPEAQYPGSEGHAIRFNDHAAHIVFDGNQVTDNAGLAVQITSGNDVNALYFRNNVFRNNRDGVINRYPGDTVLWEGNQEIGNGAGGVAMATRGAVAAAPTASFSAPAQVRVGQPVAFRNTSTAAGGDIDHVLWDFGAGVPATESSPTFTYERPGEYRVSLVVWDRQGRGALAPEQVIRVTAP